MPVQSDRTTLFRDCQELQQFLFNCQQISLKKDRTQLVSISWEVSLLDPLAVFARFKHSNKLHFYLENPERHSAIVALDASTHFWSDNSPRFQKAQAFIESCLENTITTGHLDLPFAGPHFFCNFTFFDQTTQFNAPFPPALVFLPRWQISRQGNCSVVVANLAVDLQTKIPLAAQQIWQTLQKIRPKSYGAFQPWIKPEYQWDLKNMSSFQDAVNSALESINRRRFQKIVLSHALDITAPRPFEIVRSLAQLRKRYRDCYIFSTGNGKGQHFIGASPERSIEIHSQQLTTDALAGSAPRGATTAEDAALANRLLSSQKEQHEHQVVLDFIIQHLNRLGVKLQPIPPMRLLQLSNIQHLWTPIQAEVPASVHPLQIVAELHPTPAVAGAPQAIACQEIRRYETFDRSLYAAPLGWIDGQGNSEFIVGIRSALVHGCRARLYAGAGIVAGSDPEKELAEIQLKFQALLKALVFGD